MATRGENDTGSFLRSACRQRPVVGDIRAAIMSIRSPVVMDADTIIQGIGE